jgi:hypothetical protein
MAPSAAPTLPDSAEAQFESAVAKKNLDECEALLKRAIEMVHGPARCPQIAIGSELVCEASLEPAIHEMVREAAPAIAVAPDLTPPDCTELDREPEPSPKRPLVVEIHYDHLKARW